MIPESFSQLTTDLEAELYRLHYTQATISYYRRMWSLVAAFLDHEQAAEFTEELGLRFLDQQYDFLARCVFSRNMPRIPVEICHPFSLKYATCERV